MFSKYTHMQQTVIQWEILEKVNDYVYVGQLVKTNLQLDGWGGVLSDDKVAYWDSLYHSTWNDGFPISVLSSWHKEERQG